jgi:cell shape-determining protein MreD
MAPGVAAGLLLGLTGDLVVGRLVGLGALTLAMAGGLAGAITRRVFRDNLVVVGAIAAVLGMLTVTAYAALGWALGVRFNTWGAIVAIGAPVGLYCAVLVPLVYAIGFRSLNRPEQGLPDRRPLSGGGASE